MRDKTKQLLENLDEHYFEQVYRQNNNEDTADILGFSVSQVKLIAKYLNIKRTREEINELREKHILQTYNSKEEYYKQRQIKIKQTNLERYGNENYNNIEQGVKTRLSKYESQEEYNKHFKEVFLQTIIDKYGNWDNYVSTHSQHFIQTVNNRTPEQTREIYSKTTQAWKNKTLEEVTSISEKRKKTILQTYGSYENYKQHMLQNLSSTIQERYGVPWPCMREEARLFSGSFSKINKEFGEMLSRSSVPFRRELNIERFSYDFQIQNYVLELNPTVTHNVTWSPFKDHKGISQNYHYNKSKTAYKNGYNCIHIWDWDDKEEIIRFLGSLDDNTYFIDNHENNSIDLKSSDMKVLHSFSYSLHEQGVLNLGCNGIWNNYINNYFVQFVKANFYVNKIKLDLDLSKCFVPRFDNYKVLKQIKPQCYNITLGQDTSVDVYDCGRQIIEIEL